MFSVCDFNGNLLGPASPEVYGTYRLQINVESRKQCEVVRMSLHCQTPCLCFCVNPNRPWGKAAFPEAARLQDCTACVNSDVDVVSARRNGPNLSRDKCVLPCLVVLKQQRL